MHRGDRASALRGTTTPTGVTWVDRGIVE
jgi:hypothetical protein